MKVNILITGVSGFVGNNLVEYFRSYPEINIYGLDITFQTINNVKNIYSWDKINEIPDMDIVIHLAGIAHDLKNNANEQIYFDINYGLTKKIYDWFLSSNGSKFIFMSSVKAVADTVKKGPLKETTEASPITAYGRSKKKAEEYIIDNSESKGKGFYILRPCMIHGPGNKGNLNLLYNLVRKGIPYPLGAFQNQRSFTSIGNLSYVIMQLIEKDISSGIYQVADDKPLSTNEIIRLIAIVQEKKDRIWNINKGIIKMFTKIGDLFHLPLNSERLKKMTESYVVSNKKIKEVFGINKMPVTAIEGMKSSLSSFHQNGREK